MKEPATSPSERLEGRGPTRTRDRAKGRFVSMVAHELKAPIGAVEGYLHLLREGAFDADPDRRASIIDRCLERTGALVELIRDVVELAQRDGGALEYRVEPVEIGALCLDIVSAQTNEASRQAVSVTVDVGAELMQVRCNRRDLERVLQHLLSNAIKYNRRGGEATVRARVEGGALRLEVSDNGLGMNAEESARVGEEFFRAKNEWTRHIPGTGLGLSLVKAIVEAYRGSWSVQTSPGAGSTFAVLLPLEALANKFSYEENGNVD